MNREGSHLSAERLQALLEGSLPRGDAEATGAHVASCARCRAELEAWEVLFHELDGMGELAPSRDFADRVMASLPEREPQRLPLAARVRSWLGRDTALPASDRHVAADRLQDFLEGMLPARAAAGVEGHLNGCRFCREEARTWRSLMVDLDGLPHVAPSAAFTERVMAHVRVQNAVALARPTARERLVGFVEGISPRARKRGAAVAGALVTPTVTLALVVYTVFSHPLVTLGSLTSFLWFKTGEMMGGLASSLFGIEAGQGLVESVALFRAWSVVELVSRSPTAAAVAFTMVGGLTLVALWVLYRNLFATDHVDGQHAHFSF